MNDALYCHIRGRSKEIRATIIYVRFNATKGIEVIAVSSKRS